MLSTQYIRCVKILDSNVYFKIKGRKIMQDNVNFFLIFLFDFLGIQR